MRGRHATSGLGHDSTGRPTAAPLVVAADGDTAQLLQLVTQQAGSRDRLTTRRPELGSRDRRDAARATIRRRSRSPCPTSRRTTSLAVHWKRSQFEALRDGVGANATDLAGWVSGARRSEALPGATARGWYGDVVHDVMTTTCRRRRARLDVDATFTYADPFATGGTPWDEFAIVGYAFGVPVMSPNATMPTMAVAEAEFIVPVSALQGGVIAPLVTPVPDIAVGGMDATVPATGVGVTPLVAWDPPSTGTPTCYELVLSEVTASGVETQLRSLAAFYTTARSLQLPRSDPAARRVLRHHDQCDRRCRLHRGAVPQRLAVRERRPRDRGVLALEHERVAERAAVLGLARTTPSAPPPRRTSRAPGSGVVSTETFATRPSPPTLTWTLTLPLAGDLSPHELTRAFTRRCRSRSSSDRARRADRCRRRRPTASPPPPPEPRDRRRPS